jgi:hypothetical protein
MSSVESLALELRFRHTADAKTWQRLLEAIIAFAPSLRPATVLRLADPEQREQPWSPSLQSAICQACSAGLKDGWLLGAAGGPIGAITLDVRRLEVRCSLAMPRMAGSLIDTLVRFLETLVTVYGLALALAFDLTNSVDSELLLQGLSGITQASPLLYFDWDAVAVAGGVDRVRMTPCRVLNAPGGLLLVLRTDPWVPLTKEDRNRIAAVERHLGMAPERPLVLLEAK